MIKGTTIIGIDPSTSATGIVVINKNEPNLTEPLIAYEIKPAPKLTGIDRYVAIITEIMKLVESYRPVFIVIEGYSLNMRHASSVIPLVEIGSLLRFMLRVEKISWLDPRASELKKFATGKGNTPKDTVMLNVYKKWGFEATTNNIADAYVLAMMGLAHIGKLPGATKEMSKIANGLKLKCN